MKLLCLHGMYQRSCIFRSKTAHLGMPGVELAFLDGPINLVPKVVSTSSKQVDTKGFKAWWDPAQPLAMADRAQLLRYVGDAMDRDGPFDGVLGFSQGAVLASWLCSNFAKHELGWAPSLAVLLGGYCDPRDVASIFEGGLVPTVASFHAYGINDRVVSAAKSEQLAALFEAETPGRVTRHVHQQGHIIPKCPMVYDALQDFLGEMDETIAQPPLQQAQQA
ncbi:hypothetical protein SDRG_10353 [Saprolegnia diclina VS20]|uniref:Serine hydrolase domain-containing protein n=1 Tax=Saprolegnia diclina (strain VS20) TaxID=1156394 RepID=T0RII3_SAPDV|nr:hypothetical protein SDRG_10353 [Saprolegnia diclina VS20]EQC32158.1 hypothetical protein SDRG_10353 [Saprolegnia diclina VS20]|eukprot:XP_008614560.1 hypothetical protein SDRG_10353 [Saprolegnia diclina VS20]